MCPPRHCLFSRARRCVLFYNRRVSCWGDNTYNQMGLGEAYRSTLVTTLLAPLSVHPITDVSTMSAGAHHTCAVTASLSLACWGRNNAGQLGIGSTATVYTPTVVLSNVLRVSAGGQHTCAVLLDLSVRCWGANGTLCLCSSICDIVVYLSFGPIGRNFTISVTEACARRPGLPQACSCG